MTFSLDSLWLRSAVYLILVTSLRALVWLENFGVVISQLRFSLMKFGFRIVST